MNFDVITSENFLIYATKAYNNPSCTTLEEFNDDLRLFVNIKRWLNKPTKNTNIRILTNQFIIATNIFGVEAVPRLLFCYNEQKTHGKIKAILEYLNMLPESMTEVVLGEIESCVGIVKELESL